MSNIPRQVLEQAERADRMMAELQTPAPQEPVVAAVEPVIAEPQPPQEPVAPQVETPPPPPQAPPEQRVDWKAKYLVLKGKYDAEVPRMSESIRDLRAQLQLRIEEITQLKSSGAPTGNTPATPNDDDFDPELLAAVERRVNAAVKPLEASVNDTAKVQAQLAWQRFINEVQGEVPDYEAVDATPEFQSWCEELEPIAGKTRGELLDEAIRSQSSGRVIAVYRQYKSATKGAAPSQTNVVQSNEIRPVPLAERVVPAPASSAATPEPPAKIWSRGTVAKFYADVTRGLYRNRREEAASIEAEITKAYTEGRVQ